MKKHWKQWQPFQLQHQPDGTVLFFNNRYHVFARKMRNPRGDGPDLLHLSIRDNERSSRHDWRDFQRIKSEIVGPEFEMVEMYPRESQLVDYANQYHLWGFLTEEPLFTRMGFGFEEGRQIWDGIGPRPTVPDADTSNAVQRPMRSE